MKFLKDNAGLRMLIIALLFAAGLVLTFVGWKMTGKLAGLGLMILGMILLLTALLVYNKTYQ